MDYVRQRRRGKGNRGERKRKRRPGAKTLYPNSQHTVNRFSVVRILKRKYPITVSSRSVTTLLGNASTAHSRLADSTGRARNPTATCHHTLHAI